MAAKLHGGEARMNASGEVRWGIIGTANIARGQFLPGLRSAGGVAAAVAGRDAARTEQWASDNGVERAVTGYQALIDDPDIDVLYIPLPNALHAEWTIRALESLSKPVLCEKPLCGTLRDARSGCSRLPGRPGRCCGRPSSSRSSRKWRPSRSLWPTAPSAS